MAEPTCSWQRRGVAWLLAPDFSYGWWPDWQSPPGQLASIYPDPSTGWRGVTHAGHECFGDSLADLMDELANEVLYHDIAGDRD